MFKKLVLIPLTILLISIALTFGLVMIIAEATNNTNVEETNYALTTKVVMIDYPTDVVWCEDFNGNVWEFYGCEDWAVGDIASLLMNDKGTENIEDDAIMSARYNGTFEGWR